MIILKKIVLKFKNLFIKFFNFFKRVFSNKVTYNQNSFKLRSDNWITKYRFDTFANKEPETLKWIDKNFIKNDVFLILGLILEYILYMQLQKIFLTLIFIALSLNFLILMN